MTSPSHPAPPPGSSSIWARIALPSAAVAVGGVSAVLRNRYQHSQVFSPARYPDGIWEPAVYGLPAEDVWFEAGDGVRLHGWWVEHPRPRGTVLYCHGNNGNVSHRIGALIDLRRLKVNLLAFDYRGYGRSDGEPSEAGLYRDVRAAWKWLAEEKGISPEQVILFGHSLGGAVAIDAALDCPAAGLVVQSSFTQVRDMVKVLFRALPVHLIARNQFRSIDKVADLAMPKLFVHGTDDPTVPHALGRRLFERAAEPKEWFEIPRAGHNDVYRQAGFRYGWRLQRFVSRCLP